LRRKYDYFIYQWLLHYNKCFSEIAHALLPEPAAGVLSYSETNQQAFESLFFLTQNYRMQSMYAFKIY